MKIKTFITIFLVLLIKFGDAQSWIYVTSNEEDAKIYIRSNPVYLTHTIKVWVKSTEGKIRNDKNGVQVIPHGSTLSLVEFDCINQKYRIYALADLDSIGNVVDSIDVNGYQTFWYPIVPDSVYENILKKVCELTVWN